MRLLLTGAAYQLRLLRRSPGDLIALATTPLLTVVFLAVVEHNGRPDLAVNAVLAPALIALWGMSLLIAGDMIDAERATGTFEVLVATPARLWPLFTGRVLVVTVVSLLGLVESWLVATVVFGVPLRVAHPGLFAVTLLATVLAMSGHAGVMTSLFVLSRSARIFQNSLSFPFYVLGGVLVPVALLPAFLRPVSTVVFLSWSADLLRDSLRPATPDSPVLRVGMVLGLGAAGAALSWWLLSVVLRRARRTGTIALGG